ncbi:hypothetical protein MCEMIE22_00675 [Mycobacteriaceae bacterium]
MQRLGTQRWTIEDEVAGQLCSEVLRVRRAATITAHIDPCPRTVAGDQMVAYRARGSQQCLIIEHPRFNRDRICKNFLDRSQGIIPFDLGRFESVVTVSTEIRANLTTCELP